MKSRFNLQRVGIVSFGHFMHDVYTSFLSPLVPLLIDKLQISMTLVGLLDVIRKVPSLFNPLIGLIADKICVKYLIILAPAIASILMSLIGLASSYFILALLLFFTGINSSLFHVPAPVAIKRFSGDKTGTGMSMYMLGGELARSLGPVYITAAVSYWGLEGSYRVMPLGIIASILLFVKLRNVKNIVNESNTKPNDNKHKYSKISGLNGLFVLSGLYIFFRSGIKSAFSLFLPVYLVQSGESLWLAGIALSIFQFSGAAGTLGAGMLSDKIGKRNTLIIAAFVSPLFMWAFLLSSSYLSILWLVLLGIFVFAQGPVLLAMFQDAKSKRPAFVNSIYMTINFGVNALAVLIAGKLSDVVSLEYTLHAAGIMALVAIPVSFFMPKK